MIQGEQGSIARRHRFLSMLLLNFSLSDVHIALLSKQGKVSAFFYFDFENINSLNCCWIWEGFWRDYFMNLTLSQPLTATQQIIMSNLICSGLGHAWKAISWGYSLFKALRNSSSRYSDHRAAYNQWSMPLFTSNQSRSVQKPRNMIFSCNGL